MVSPQFKPKMLDIHSTRVRYKQLLHCDVSIVENDLVCVKKCGSFNSWKFENMKCITNLVCSHSNEAVTITHAQIAFYSTVCG